MDSTTLVLGLGNILLGDDGAGVRAVKDLQSRYEFPPNVQILDGGTLGLDLLPFVESARQLLVLDALEMGAQPGQLKRLENEQVPSALSVKLSPHQAGLCDLLAAARLCECYPEDLVLWGIQPGSLDIGTELSSTVEVRVTELVERAVEELEHWSIKPAKKCGHKEGR